MIDIKSLNLYLEYYFLTPVQFIKAANISLEQFYTLIEAKAMPGPVYKLWKNDAVWSPIGGQHGNPGAGIPESTWFTPAALWPARQAKVLMENENLTSEQVAKTFRDSFAEEFRAALINNDAQSFEYQHLFDGSNLVESKLEMTIEEEWQGWITGGYAVCLRRWDGSHPVIKNVEIAQIRTLTNDGTKPSLSSKELKKLINAIKRLDAVMLPFAPYQRPYGSPGKWVDHILNKYELGHVPMTVGDGQQFSTTHLRLCC